MKHLIALALLLSSFCIRHSSFAAPPNVILIVADDLGWADLGCCGSQFHQSPNLDKLAAQGMRFTQAYAAAPVCSPTRAALMTGKSPARLGLTRHLAPRPQPSGKLVEPPQPAALPPGETTVAEVLRRQGYATGIVGKWHLGHDAAGPQARGFDFVFGGDDQGLPRSYFSPYGIPKMPDGPKGEYLTDRLTAEAGRFLDESKARPFLLVLTHFAPHVPLQAPADLVAKYRAKPKQGGQGNPTYAAMLEKLDDSVGGILDKLDALKLTENTVVIFTSDNGGTIHHAITSNAPLRGGKTEVYEGGLRVPLLVRWPGKVRAGATCDVPVVSMDLPRTILALSGAQPGAGEFCDGEDLAPVLADSRQELRRDALFFHYPHYHDYGAKPAGAMRAGDWKLIEHYEDGALELFNLRDDPGETKNLVTENPAKVKQLHERFTAWRKDVKAKMPAPNPQSDKKAEVSK